MEYRQARIAGETAWLKLRSESLHRRVPLLPQMRLLIRKLAHRLETTGLREWVWLLYVAWRHRIPIPNPYSMHSHPMQLERSQSAYESIRNRMSSHPQERTRSTWLGIPSS